MRYENKITSLIVISFFFFLTSCAPRVKMPNIPVNYYPQCYQPFKTLKQSQDRMQKRTLAYTAGTAVATGVGVGLLTGLVSGNWKTGLISGIAAGVAGGFAGYNIAQIENIKDTNRRMYAYREVMSADLINSTEIELTALQSLKCYIHEFEIIQQQLSTGKITKAEFESRYKEIRIAIQELGKITGDTKTLIAMRETEVRSSIEKEFKKTNYKPISKFETVASKREQRKRRSQVSRMTHKKRRARTSVPAANVPVSSFELASIKSNIDALSNEARADYTRYQQQNILPKKEQETTNAAAAKNQTTAHDIEIVYSNYPDKVAQIEEIENQRVRTLEIMDEAASKTGIDMV